MKSHGKNTLNYFVVDKEIDFYGESARKLIWKNKWIHIRKSNTEPILRIYSESKNISDAKNLIDDVKKYFY